jgi:hypothetical protein
MNAPKYTAAVTTQSTIDRINGGSLEFTDVVILHHVKTE